MTYEEWEAGVHERVKAEPVWEFLGYRRALFLALLVSELNRQRSRRLAHR